MPTTEISLEESILTGELSLDKIFNAFTDGVYDYNIKNKLTFVSDNFYRLLGYEPGEFELTDERWDNLIHPEDLEQSNSLFFDHLDGKTSRYVAEYRMLRKDGSYQWISCTGQLIGKDRDGKPSRVVGAIKSIQSKKQLELGMKMLIHASSTLTGRDFFTYMTRNIAKLFQVKYALIVITDDKNPIEVEALVMWNVDQIKDSFNYKIKDSPSELIYSQQENVFTWDDLESKFPKDEFIKKNKIVGYYGMPIRNPSNELIGHICIMHDSKVIVRHWMESMIELFAQSIGSEVERINNEEKLYELNKLLDLQVKERTVQLEKAVEDLDSFFYKASHDLRAPITTLEGIYNLLESEIDSDEKARLFKLLGMQITSIKKLNRSIIEVGNIRNHEYSSQSVQLDSLLREILQSLSQPQSISIEKVVDHSLEISTDKFLLTTILMEFISNSIKHRDPEKSLATIRIETLWDEDQLELEIKDNGKGISSRIEQDYFKLFLRASTTSSGFGLGLYKAKLAADKANITIEINSKEGVGTLVKLRF
ncbi:PAS domain-containing protein [Ekhidna sp.]|uniref:PAS domain-containing sensor histidine kinase n=1 Tax=Ekhidna sp. TaxID=2608089 RepID=UPI003B50116F